MGSGSLPARLLGLNACPPSSPRQPSYTPNQLSPRAGTPPLPLRRQSPPANLALPSPSHRDIGMLVTRRGSEMIASAWALLPHPPLADPPATAVPHVTTAVASRRPPASMTPHPCLSACLHDYASLPLCLSACIGRCSARAPTGGGDLPSRPPPVPLGPLAVSPSPRSFCPVPRAHARRPRCRTRTYPPRPGGLPPLFPASPSAANYGEGDCYGLLLRANIVHMPATASHAEGFLTPCLYRPFQVCIDRRFGDAGWATREW